MQNTHPEVLSKSRRHQNLMTTLMLKKKKKKHGELMIDRYTYTWLVENLQRMDNRKYSTAIEHDTIALLLPAICTIKAFTKTLNNTYNNFRIQECQHPRERERESHTHTHAPKPSTICTTILQYKNASPRKTESESDTDTDRQDRDLNRRSFLS
jgi:hypothetical protein